MPWVDRQAGAGWARRRDLEGARWARRRDLEALLVRQSQPGRLVLGRWGRSLLAAESRQSVLVVGPTQTMKTSGLAVPALLEWEGPVLASSVKTDLVRDTLAARKSRGRVWIYDPAGCTGLPADSWSPLAGARTWAGARRTASALIDAARSGASSNADTDFWYATSAKLLAPLLFAAAISGRSMADVVRWVDTQADREVLEVLTHAGHEAALTAAQASFSREERARSSIFTTTETVLDPFAEPDRFDLDGGEAASIDPGPLLDGGAHTLYLCAPAHEQRRLRPLFSALVDQVVRAVYERCSATGCPLDPPLLMVLDEAAAIAPLEDLDGLAATGAGQGVQLVTVWRDLAQITARYGSRAASVVNNHRAKIILSGLSDPGTLDQVSSLLGDAPNPESSTTTDAEGARSTTDSTLYRRLAPVDAIRRIQPGQGLLLYGHLPPARLALRPWFAEPALRSAGRGLN
jgi:type IV secretion system protein VirD4